ncbi:hypothetical protein [Poseidonibacter ostreae]|uniref:hypothetical protein n=1 Tax=Poseidonibacter ostreae TaxID=2654171 RepID=UPI00186B05C8|nr:hypothetical protein [Poseidonibacter ostreae]
MELTKQQNVEYFFSCSKGIVANNKYRAEFISKKKLLFLGSIYPQPMKEEYLLTSELE